jgi:hypothetical protein
MMSGSFDWDGQQQASMKWSEQIEQTTPEDYLSRLEESGWLEAVGMERAEELRDRLMVALKENPSYSFYELADTEFDADCIEEAGTDDSCSYFSIIMQLAHDSRSLFEPTEVTDRLDRESSTASVSFVHQGKDYSCEVTFKDEWFQEPVLQLVNEALAESGTMHRFIDLPSCNQTLSLALVPESVFTQAVQLGLIPDVRFYAPRSD